MNKENLDLSRAISKGISDGLKGVNVNVNMIPYKPSVDECVNILSDYCRNHDCKMDCKFCDSAGQCYFRSNVCPINWDI